MHDLEAKRLLFANEGRYHQMVPAAVISYDRFHAVARANKAMDRVRRTEMREAPDAVAAAVGVTDTKAVRNLMWTMRKDAEDWNPQQLYAMHWLRRSGLQSARAWR